MVAIVAICAGALTGASAHAAPSTPTSSEPEAGITLPPMGWNNWAEFQCGPKKASDTLPPFNENLIKGQADALVEKGLLAAGYNTVTVDDCWMLKDRGSAGELVPNPTTFPGGMGQEAGGLGAHIHEKGLKYGVYLDAGVLTCEYRAGSYDHMAGDMKQLAGWGADFVKMDGCNMPTVEGETAEQTYRRVYTEASQAIAASGRKMLFSNSSPAYFRDFRWQIPGWYSMIDTAGSISELWREAADIKVANGSLPGQRWASMMNNYDYNKSLARFSSPGHYNDPDFIISGSANISDEEARTQLSLWSMMASPLILSTDVTKLTTAQVADLTNARMLAIDQDRLGKQGHVVRSDANTEVLVRELANGDFAVAFLNRSASTQSISVKFSDLGYAAGTYSSVNVWSGAKSTPKDTLAADVPSHGTAMFRITPPTSTQLTAQGQATLFNYFRPTVCVDATKAFTSSTASLETATCTTAATQQITRGPDDTLVIKGKCVAPGAPGDVVFATLADCGTAAGVSWGYTKIGQLVNKSTGQCLETSTSNIASGARLQLGTCGRIQVNQIFSIPGPVTSPPLEGTATPPTGVVYASDLAWTVASNGIGEARRDAANGKDAYAARVALEPWPGATPSTTSKGIGVRSTSDIWIYLGGNCTAFTSDIGLQNAADGSAIFSVSADKEKQPRAQSAVLTKASGISTLSVDVTGAQWVVLSVRLPAGAAQVDADWFGAQFTCAPAPVVVPPAVPETLAVSDIVWASASTSWGTIGRDMPVRGGGPDVPLTASSIDPATGTKLTWQKGIGVNAPSTIGIATAGRCSALTASVALQDGFNGKAVFSVITDGVEVFSSGTMSLKSEPVPLSVDLTGAQIVELRASTAPNATAAGAHANWLDPKITCTSAPTGTVYASDLIGTVVATTWGETAPDAAVYQTVRPGTVKLKAAWTDPATNTRPTYDKGIGVHATSALKYSVGARCSTFTSLAAIQDGFAGTVLFSVWKDDVNVFTSEPVTQGTKPVEISVDVSGAQDIELHVDPVNSNNTGAHADWLNAQFVCS